MTKYDWTGIVSNEFIEGKRLKVYFSEGLAQDECERLSQLDRKHYYIYQKIEDGWEVRQLDPEE